MTARSSFIAGGLYQEIESWNFAKLRLQSPDRHDFDAENDASVESDLDMHYFLEIIERPLLFSVRVFRCKRVFRPRFPTTQGDLLVIDLAALAQP